MYKFEEINDDSLLIKSDSTNTIQIHYGFYFNHVLNLFEENDDRITSTEAMLAFKRNKLEKIKETLEKLHIYKIIDIKNLKYVLREKNLFFDRVSDSWEDPYENFFLKEHFVDQDGLNIGAENNIPGVYGQSWTIINESDALLRIYSEDDKDAEQNHLRNYHGIRIETTARKLLDTIYVDDASMACTWIGKVEYSDIEEINQQLISEKVLDFGKSLGESFFKKRKEFSHEEEFRVITMFDSQTLMKYPEKKRIAFQISNLDDFIDSYVLDPRLEESNYNTLRDCLLSYGIDPDKISKSNLYHFDPIKVLIQ